MSEKQLIKGQRVSCHPLENQFIEVCFDNQTTSVNKFDVATLEELQKCVDAIHKEKNVKGVLFTSGKEVFVVGADITEFLPMFAKGAEELTSWLRKTQKLFNAIEDWDFPSVAAIPGVCLGGGFELALAATYRIASTKASIGLPETKLGIFPGWGGTVRLPRLIGVDNALEWIAGGGTFKPEEALRAGAIDSVTTPEDLRKVALATLQGAAQGLLRWRKKRDEKLRPLTFKTPLECSMAFETARGMIAAKAYPHYPAPLEALKVMQESATSARDAALENELKGFVKVAKTPTAESLVSIFLSDQFNKKKTKDASKSGKPVRTAGVLGAGIMGGGIAYQSASRGIPILMKDITPAALQTGLTEAAKLLNKQVERKKIDTFQMAKVMGSIASSLSFGDFGNLDIVIEAVVENAKIKQSVLCEVENAVKDGTIIASNTSTISISSLAEKLRKPENFCGMHFFNPVHLMPLVEVIRGNKTSDQAIGTTVAYALAMGKTPIVVQDCPGFLVNRILFPYFAGFMSLLENGIDFVRIDKVMEKFGWPMGPAYLLDVIGLDTAMHADRVMASSYSSRMAHEGRTATEILVSHNRLGQKNSKGFYAYQPDKKGYPKKTKDPSVYPLFESTIKTRKEVSDEDIVWRMMIPMINESARCLEEKIVATPMEVDLGLIYGVGFPPFLGGALKYADTVGLDKLCAKGKELMPYGNCFEPAPLLQALNSERKKFYQWTSV